MWNSGRDYIDPNESENEQRSEKYMLQKERRKALVCIMAKLSYDETLEFLKTLSSETPGLPQNVESGKDEFNNNLRKMDSCILIFTYRKESDRRTDDEILRDYKQAKLHEIRLALFEGLLEMGGRKVLVDLFDLILGSMFYQIEDEVHTPDISENEHMTTFGNMLYRAIQSEEVTVDEAQQLTTRIVEMALHMSRSKGQSVTDYSFYAIGQALGFLAVKPLTDALEPHISGCNNEHALESILKGVNQTLNRKNNYSKIFGRSVVPEVELLASTALRVFALDFGEVRMGTIGYRVQGDASTILRDLMGNHSQDLQNILNINSNINTAFASWRSICCESKVCSNPKDHERYKEVVRTLGDGLKPIPRVRQRERLRR